MENNNQNSRRTFLSTTVKGAALFGAGLVAPPFVSAFASPSYAENELEFRTRLGVLGTLSLMTSELALTKASNERIKMFAKFEAAEQTAVSTVLKELSTPMPGLDAKGTAILDKLKEATGAAFDMQYMMAQVDVHRQLRSLTESFVSGSKGSTSMPEMHTRHVAIVALATIKEHVELSKMLSDTLK